MESVIQVIRSLHSEFRVLARDSISLKIRVTSVHSADFTGPCLLEFHNPTHPWACEWDVAAKGWRDRFDLAEPGEGRIDEAFIKHGGQGYILSFAERIDPLVRWGFTASSVSVRADAADADASMLGK